LYLAERYTTPCRYQVMVVLVLTTTTVVKFTKTPTSYYTRPDVEICPFKLRKRITATLGALICSLLFQEFDLEVAVGETEVLCTRTKLLEGVAKTPDRLFAYCAQLLQDAVQLHGKVEQLAASPERAKLLKRIAGACRTVHNFSMASQSFVATTSATPSTSAPSGSIMKLKNIQPPAFSGDYKYWKFFWDNFDHAVHANPQYSDLERYLILSNLLKEQPLELLKGYSMADGYRDAIEKLK